MNNFESFVTISGCHDEQLSLCGPDGRQDGERLRKEIETQRDLLAAQIIEHERAGSCWQSRKNCSLNSSVKIRDHDLWSHDATEGCGTDLTGSNYNVVLTMPH